MSLIITNTITYYLPKNGQKHTILFQKKVEKHTILAGQGRPGQVPHLLSPADAHATTLGTLA